MLPYDRMVQCAPVECEKSGSKVREARWAPMQEDNNKLQRQSLVSHLRVQYFWSIVVTNRLIGSGVFSKWRRAYRMDHDLLLASQDYNKLERTHLKVISLFLFHAISHGFNHSM